MHRGINFLKSYNPYVSKYTHILLGYVVTKCKNNCRDVDVIAMVMQSCVDVLCRYPCSPSGSPAVIANKIQKKVFRK